MRYRVGIQAACRWQEKAFSVTELKIRIGFMILYSLWMRWGKGGGIYI